MLANNPPRRTRVEGSFNQGWGVALLVIAIAIAANVVATKIHYSSYTRSPEGGASNLGERSRAHNATHGY